MRKEKYQAGRRHPRTSDPREQRNRAREYGLSLVGQGEGEGTQSPGREVGSRGLDKKAVLYKENF